MSRYCGQLWWSIANFKIRAGSFSQVELGGLEPPTPCLQSMAKMSSTVCGLAWSGLLGPPEYSNVQVCWCRLWVSSRLTDGHLERREVRAEIPALRRGADRCEDDRVASDGGRDSRLAVGPR
jgi:hypothetical protein